MPERLLTVKELAEYLGVPVTTVYQWNHLGVGPRYFRVGKYTRFRPDDVEEWLERRQDSA
jgi:excisionase family DNA binding protein